MNDQIEELELAEETPTQVIVAATMPEIPLILADDTFVRKLGFFEERAKIMAVESPEAATQAAQMLSEITTAGRKLEASRLALARPFLEIQRTILATAKPVAARIDAAKNQVQKHILRWQDAERVRIKKEEAARQRELDLLEAKRREEEAAAAKKAAEIAASAQPIDSGLELDEELEQTEEPAPKTETEKQIEAIKFAPAVAAEKPTGVRYKSRLIFTVDDVNALPDQFVILTPNERLIREQLVVGWTEDSPLPVLPGVTFKVDKTVISTGRNPTSTF